MLAWRLFLIATLCLFTSLQIVKAETHNYDLVYHVQWGDSPLDKALASWELSSDTYRFDGTVQTEGTLSFFYEFEG